MISSFSLFLVLLALFKANATTCTTYCSDSDYTAKIDNLCYCCSYPSTTSFSGYTCQGCNSASYSILTSLDGTQQKCITSTTSGSLLNPTVAPNNLVSISGNLKECGEGCSSCSTIPSTPTDYHCSGTIDSSRKIIQHPTIADGYMKIPTYDCDAFYINTNGAYQGYYYDSTSSSCKKCSTNCFSCNQENAAYCTECAYSKIRYSSLATFYTSLATSAMDCSALSSRSGTATLTYYLRPKGTACTSSPCANTMNDYTTYYDSFYDIMTDLIDNQKIQEKTSVTVTIYIFKTLSGTVGQIYLTHSFPTTQSLLYGRVFDRVLSTVTIKAAEKCQTNFGHTDNTYCYDTSNNERPQIYLKSAYIFFFVTNVFTLKNVELHGGDLMKAFDNTINAQYSSYCDPSFSGSITVAACQPSANGWFYMDPIDPLSGTTPNYYSKSVHKTRPNGFFVLQYIRDVTSPVVPQLIIDGCIIYNFYQHKHAYSFIYFEEAGFITIKNSYFYNIFFYNGLISNTPTINFEIQKASETPNSYYRLHYNVDRGNPYSSKNKGLSCKSSYFGLTSVITTDCHQINITSSYFQSFNPYNYRRVPLNSYVLTNAGNTNNVYNTYDYTATFNSNSATSDGSAVNYNIFQEGLLMGVSNINGKIHLSNNIFKRALSSVNHRLDLQHNCAPFQFTHGYSPDQNEESIDIVSTSSYKLNIDKHMRQHLEAEERVISSLIYIRELHNEFIMYNNTFDSIIAETGSVLFVEDFKTSSSYPIMINLNKFTNNLAYAFGANIVFKKNSIDVTQTDCVGIVLSGNQFFSNIGCTNTYGNVIISCEPNHPAACPTRSSVFGALFYDIKGINTQTSWASSFSTYYQYYNFKVDNTLNTKSNNDATLEAAFDAFVVNKSSTYTETYDTTNALVNPYTGDKFPYNVLIYSNNTCSTNYLLISNCIYIEGSMGIFMENNKFSENGVPLEDFFQQPFYQHSGFNFITGNTIQSGFIENNYLTIMKESSPIVIRIAGYVHMKKNTFKSNFAVFLGDFYFGACITMEKMLGIGDITIESSTFKSHYGYNRFFIQPTSSYYYDYCSFPLISLNHWVVFRNINPISSFTINRKISSHNILILNSEFSSNTFYLTASKPNTNPLIHTNLTKANYYAKITYTKVTPAANFVYNLLDPTKVSIQNSGTVSSKYNKLTASVSSPELYSFIFKHFLDEDVVSSSSSFGFKMNDKTNLNPLFATIKLSFSGCLFDSNTNYAGLPFLYTYSFNFSMINCNYNSNIVSEAPQVFALAASTTSLAHIVHNSGTTYASPYAVINFTMCNFDSNTGLLFTFMDSGNVAPTMLISGLYLSNHFINKSSICYASNLGNANINNITATSSTFKNGVISLYSISNSIVSNLNFFKSYCEQTACIYGSSLTNVLFFNVSCYKMAVIAPYLLSIVIDPAQLSHKQPTSSIIMSQTTNATFINLYFSQLSLAHNGMFTVTSTVYIQNFTVLNIFSGQTWPSAIYITSDSNAYVTGGSFYNITCGVCQGSLFVTKLMLSLTGIIVMNVTSNYGFLYAEDSTVNIASSRFINNTGLQQDPTILGKGGVISIYSTEFSNNSCLMEDTLSFLSSQVLIYNSSFNYNSAITKTKGVFFSECASASIINCNFVDFLDGSSSIIAGFVYSIETSLTITGSMFNGSISTNGAVYVKGDSSFLIVSQSRFINNNASLDSPALFASCSVTMLDCYFDTNILSGSSSKAGHVLIESTDSLIIQGCNFSNFTTNALYLTTIINVSISNSLFYGNSSISENRGIYLINCYNVNISSTTFKYLVTQSSGAGLYLICSSSNNVSLMINKTIFFNNIAQNGGGMALDLSESSILTNYILNSTFFMNYATNDGGGFLYNSMNVNSVFNLSHTIISGNIAIQAGGGFRFMGMLVTYDNSSHIFNNSAYYGPNIAAYPIHMVQRVLKSPDEYSWYITYYTQTVSRLLANVSTNSSNSILNDSLGQMNTMKPNYTDIPNNFLVNESILNEALSQMNDNGADNPSFNLPKSVPATLNNKLVTGQNQVPPMIFDLIDYYGQIVGTHNSSTLSITPKGDTGTKMNGISVFSPINGSYILYPFDLHGTIGSAVSLVMTTTAMTNIAGMTYPANFSLQSTYSFVSNVRECQRNEYETDNHECWSCKAGTFNGLSGTCKTCNEFTTDCTLGGDYVGPLPGYWRLNGNVLNVLPCLTYSSCLGLTVTELRSDYYCAESLWVDPYYCITGWCNTGYQGVFCYDCVDGWAHSSDSCVSCSNNSQYYAITILLLIVVIIYIVFTIKKVLTGKKEEKKKSNKAAILMKILTNYFQLVSIVSSFDFNWSSDASQMSSGQSQTSQASAQVFNFDCVLKSLGTSSIGMRSFFLKLTFIAIFPIIAYLICKLVWFLIFLKRHKKDVCKFAFDMKNRLTTSIIVIMFIIHPTIVQTSIFSFRCKNLGNTDSPIYYLEKDFEMQCWESSHLKWLFIVALPSLIIWGFGIPMMAFFHIRKNLEKVYDFEFKRAFGFLYDGYKLERYFWEFVILYRKIIMVFISVFLVTYSLQTQALAVLAVAFLSYLIQIKSQPFEDPDLNEAEKRALINSSFTIYAGLYYISGNLPKAVDVLLIVLMVLVNANFGLFWLKTYFSEQYKQLKEAGTIDKLKEKLKKKKNKTNQVAPVAEPKNEQTPLQIKDLENMGSDEKEKESLQGNLKVDSVFVGGEENNRLMEETKGGEVIMNESKAEKNNQLMEDSKVGKNDQKEKEVFFSGSQRGSMERKKENEVFFSGSHRVSVEKKV